MPRAARSLCLKPVPNGRVASADAPRKMQTEQVEDKQKEVLQAKKEEERKKMVQEASKMPYLRAILRR